jgi:CRP-like cAMP-binding protein
MEASGSHSLVKALKAVPGFSSASDRDLLAVVGASANLRWQAGTTVFEEGDEADGLYVVLSGAVHVVGEPADQRIGPGQFFGEVALVEDVPRTRGIVALEDSELMVVPREAFDAVIEASPELGRIVREKLVALRPGAAARRARAS